MFFKSCSSMFDQSESRGRQTTTSRVITNATAVVTRSLALAELVYDVRLGDDASQKLVKAHGYKVGSRAQKFCRLDRRAIIWNRDGPFMRHL